jgi:hypothetical protein
VKPDISYIIDLDFFTPGNHHPRIIIVFNVIFLDSECDITLGNGNSLMSIGVTKRGFYVFTAIMTHRAGKGVILVDCLLGA